MSATTVVILTGLQYHSEDCRSSIEAVEWTESKITSSEPNGNVTSTFRSFGAKFVHSMPCAQLPSFTKVASWCSWWLNHVRSHQMHLVKLVASKSARTGTLKGRTCGSVVRRRVMSCMGKCRGTGPRPRYHSSKCMADKCA